MSRLIPRRSPVVNILRDPRWGRNQVHSQPTAVACGYAHVWHILFVFSHIQETYGECPYLSSLYADANVHGLQGSEFDHTHPLYMRNPHIPIMMFVCCILLTATPISREMHFYLVCRPPSVHWGQCWLQALWCPWGAGESSCVAVQLQCWGIREGLEDHISSPVWGVCQSRDL